MKRIILFCGLLLLTISLTFSQKQQNDSVKTTKLDEVVVTAQYSPRSEKNSIYKVNVINVKTIETKAVNNLTELLRQELHIDFTNDPAFGAGIEINGVSKENIKILIDGVPLIGRVKGVLNLNQINLDDIEQIEVIEGPVSIFYGTDALGGIINLITKKSQKRLVSGNISGYYESLDAKRINTNMGFKQGKNLFKFGAGYYYFNGINTDKDNTRKLNWPKKRQYNKSFKYLRDIGNFKLRFSSDYSEELLPILGNVKGTKAIDIDYTTRRFDNTLNFQGNLKNNKFIDITTSYLNYDRFDESYKFIPADGTLTLIENNPNENGNYFNTFFAKAQYADSNISNKLNYVVGVEFESDSGKGNRILDNEQEVQNTSVFTSVNYKISNKFEIQPAIRYTNNSSFGDLFSPAFNLKYRFNSENVLRFAYGKGFRAPDIKELYLDWMPTFGPSTFIFKGNEDLKLESSHSFNLYYSHRKYLNNGSLLSIEPSVAYNEIKDLIGLSELVTVGLPSDFTKERHYINLNEFKSLNTSLNVNYTMNDLKINLGVSYLGRYIEYSETFNSDEFMFTPSANTSISYAINSLDLNFNVFYKYSGKRKGHFIEEVEGTDVLQETTRDNFNNLDISFSKTFFKHKLSVILGAKNIFDVTDVETVNQIGEAHQRDIQLWGNSFFIKTKLKF